MIVNLVAIVQFGSVQNLLSKQNIKYLKLLVNAHETKCIQVILVDQNKISTIIDSVHTWLDTLKCGMTDDLC